MSMKSMLRDPGVTAVAFVTKFGDGLNFTVLGYL